MRLLPKKKSKNATKEKLKEATMDLLSEFGYASISSRDIAKRADTAVGQLTYYYKTKNALIIEVIDDLTETLIENLRQIIEESDDKIIAINNFFDELVDDDEKTSRIMIDFAMQALYNNALTNKASKFLKDLFDIISETYKQENVEDADERTGEFINSILGAILRNNIVEKYYIEDVQEKHSYFKRKRKHEKRKYSIL